MSVRVALLGAGEWGQLHARVLASLPGVDLAVVCDPEFSLAQRVAGPLGVASTEDVAAVMEDATVDAVVIASPEDVHVSQAESALRFCVRNCFTSWPSSEVKLTTRWSR